MKIAVAEAFAGMRAGHGGPFGAVIVKDGEILAQEHNHVLELNDPTAHAEMQVIRVATKKLGRFDLSDCEIYSSCEPCPMCLAAIHWAKMTKLYYGCSRDIAAEGGFDDKFIYDVFSGVAKKPQVAVEQIDDKDCSKPFQEWADMEDRQLY